MGRGGTAVTLRIEEEVVVPRGEGGTGTGRAGPSTRCPAEGGERAPAESLATAGARGEVCDVGEAGAGAGRDLGDLLETEFFATRAVLWKDRKVSWVSRSELATT